MKDSPILMSAPMVRACLDGTKTQTRRIVKAHIHPEVETIRLETVCRQLGFMGRIPGDPDLYFTPCPYGSPGDRLWVRETFMPMPHLNAKAFYRASDPLVGGKWKPSIFMPRKLSRITLEIVSVRVERLQAISEADAKAEGALKMGPVDDDPLGEGGHGYTPGPMTYLNGYEYLWESINGPGSWSLNPFVWVISFRRITP